jgi:hypothetical protein
MSKTIRSTMVILLIGLLLAVFPGRQVSALSLAQWDYYKDHPCTQGFIFPLGNGLQFACVSNASTAWVMVPMVYNNNSDQLPAVTMVYSMTGMKFYWAPLPGNYFQEGQLDRFYVTDTEYYEDIRIHPYIYQVPGTSYTNSLPVIAHIGDNTTLFLSEKYTWGEYYASEPTAPVGIAIGDLRNTLSVNNFDNIITNWSLPQNTTPPTGPLAGPLKSFISESHPFYLNNKSGSPTSTYPYYDFDPLSGAWFYSTMSSVYGESSIPPIQWNGNPAFRLNIQYTVELRAWVEPKRHFKYETRMVSPEEKGWVCQRSNFWIPPYVGGCTTSDGHAGYWSWEVIKSAVYQTGWWSYPIDSAKDWGGTNEGGYQEPKVDSSADCYGCRRTVMSWMAPDLSGVLDYCPIAVYESRPLASPPW